MTCMRILRDAVPVMFAGLALAASPTLAQTPPPAEQSAQKIEKFTATTVNLRVGAGETLIIQVSRWSTDADRDRLLAVLAEKGEAGLLPLLQEAPTLGHIWTSESLGYTVRYAHRLPSADGGERIILATDRRLGVWSRGNVWAAADAPGAPDYAFTVLELRVNRAGQGEGKMSLSAKVVAEPEGKTIALENYKAAPVLLKGVRREASK